MIAIIFSLFITLNLFLLSKPDISVLTTAPLLSLSQALSLMGTILLAQTFVLSSRFRWLTRVIGPIDKTYRLHHYLGASAFVMLINHPILLALHNFSNLTLIKKYFFYSDIISYNFGISALYLMILLLIFTFILKLPYHRWLKTHQFLTFSLMFASLHIITISSDVSRYLPLKIWIYSWLIFALFSIIYHQVIQLLIRHPRYRVAKITRHHNIIDIILEPLSRPINFIPGQIAYLKFIHDYLSTESHPYTIANATGPNLRFCIKNLGDYTSSLYTNLEVGTQVEVEGPHGNFGDKFISKPSPVIFISGGIGVTPFLSFLEHWQTNQLSTPIYHFASFKTRDEAFCLDTLTTYATTHQQYQLITSFTDVDAKINADKIIKTVGSLAGYQVYICGPNIMMESISQQLIERGFPQKYIHFENFSFI